MKVEIESVNGWKANADILPLFSLLLIYSRSRHTADFILAVFGFGFMITIRGAK